MATTASASIRSTYQFPLLPSTDQREDQQSQTKSPLLLCLISLELHEDQQLAPIAPKHSDGDLPKSAMRWGLAKICDQARGSPETFEETVGDRLTPEGNVARVRRSVGEGSRSRIFESFCIVLL